MFNAQYLAHLREHPDLPGDIGRRLVRYARPISYDRCARGSAATAGPRIQKQQ